jgi:hydroxyacylglutathione hydrolase
MGKLSGMIVPVTPFEQNCAILWDDGSKRAAVVDPGGDVDRILAAIDRTGVSVERIWLTHGHLDHAGGARGWKRRAAATASRCAMSRRTDGCTKVIA